MILDFNKLCPEAQKALLSFNGSEDTYKEMERISQRLDALGYYSDYGLDGEFTVLGRKTDLRPLFSVGGWCDVETKVVFPMKADGEADLTQPTYIDEVSNEYREKLSVTDIKTIHKQF